MLTYEQFVKAMKAFEEYDNYESKLNDMGLNLWEQEEISNLKSNYVHLLNAAMGLEEDEDSITGTDLEYFIYELDFGKDPAGLMEDSQDKKAFTSGLKVFYDYLIKK